MNTSIASTVHHRYGNTENEDSSEVANISRKDAVIIALSDLQKKIRKLEDNQKAAADNLMKLETNRQEIISSQPVYNPLKTVFVPSKLRLGSPASTAEVRCQMLEQQIGHLRKVLRQSSRNKEQFESMVSGDERSVYVKRKGNYCCGNAVKEMPASLGTLKHLRFNLDEKKCTESFSTGVGGVHFKLPFVVGHSTSSSHSVRANIQEMFSLFNSHNPLCQKLSSLDIKPSNTRHFPISTRNKQLEENIDEVILTLREEFSLMSFEYDELGRQWKEVHGACLRLNLEKEMENIVRLMNVKSEQIEKLESVRKLSNNKRTKKFKPHSSSNHEKQREILKQVKTLKSSLKTL